MKKDTPKLRSTKNYGLFVHSTYNRPVNIKGAGRRQLLQSMKDYGFLPAYPIFCLPHGNKLEIVDGQHRFTLAQKLGLPIYYVVYAKAVSIPKINGGQRAWSFSDYAGCYADQGKADYKELIDFAAKHHMPLSMASALLAGTAFSANVREDFIAGVYHIKSRERADVIAAIYSDFTAINKGLRNARLVEAIYAASFVVGFDAERLRNGAKRCPEKLMPYSTKDGYLAMIEEIYNFGRSHRVPIKIPAENAMRERNIIKKPKV